MVLILQNPDQCKFNDYLLPVPLETLTINSRYSFFCKFKDIIKLYYALLYHFLFWRLVLIVWIVLTIVYFRSLVMLEVKNFIYNVKRANGLPSLKEVRRRKCGKGFFSGRGLSAITEKGGPRIQVLSSHRIFLFI